MVPWPRIARPALIPLNTFLGFWTLCRWGNLTTNIAKSLNNALRGSRLLPIKALIDFTFNKVVQHFRKHMEIASNCQTPLPPRMWHPFNSRDRYAQQHIISEFGYTTGVYRVVSRVQTNDVGGNDYTVDYGKRECTCEKWQMHRFPYSHGIAVCHYRGEYPIHLWIKCTQRLRTNGNTGVTFCRFLMLPTGMTKVGE